jgi:hypothetical protein
MRSSHVALIGLLAMVPAGLPAQARRGPEFSVGAGGGSIRVNCDNCGGATWTGSGAVQFNALWPLGRRVLVGLGVSHVAAGSSANETDIGTLAAELRWAPNLDRGFTMRAGYGLGITNSQLTDSTGQRFANDLTGMLVTFGAGWRIPLSRRLALEPGVRSSIVAWGSVQENPEPFFQNIVSTNFAALITLSWR